MTPRVRIAPSPTGLFHIGTARTALFNYLFAKKHNGTFIVRIEDTDTERSKKEYEENILKGFKKLGLHVDEEIHRQSERKDIYRPYLEQLLQENKAYYCFHTPQEIETAKNKAEQEKKPFRFESAYREANHEEAQKKVQAGAKYVIRLKMPANTDIEFEDIVRGTQKQNTDNLSGDIVIAKNLDYPLYNLVVVIDDALMNITHVIRGEDHLSNTPKQVLIYQALGFDLPQFAHISLILNSDKSKMSKRKNAVSIDDYINDGYLPEALVNFMARLGWNDGTQQEIYSLEELIDAFSLEKLQKSGAIFDINHLQFLNNHYINQKDNQELATRIQPYIADKTLYAQTLDTCIEYEKTRSKTLKSLADGLDFYYVEIPEYDKNVLPMKKQTLEEAQSILTLLYEVFEGIDEAQWNVEDMKTLLVQKIQEWGKKNGEVLYPLRIALTGKEKSPGAFEVAECLGKENTLKRIQYATSL